MRAFRAHLLRDLTAAALAAGLLLQSAQAVAPEWWSTRGVLAAGRPADDYAAANAGQLKHLAKKAAAEMNAVLPGGAGTEIDTLIAAWSAAPAPEVTRDDYAAVSVGQLKRVAKPFYDRLGLAYPWGTGLTPDDFAVANAGQLKRVFSFLVPDAATLGLTDTDGDGFSDVLEFTEGTNPYLASDKPAGGGDVPPGGGGGGNDPGWTPAQLAAAEAAYEVGLQERSVAIYADNAVFGDYAPWDPEASWEIQYRSYWDVDIFQEAPVWEYDYFSSVGFDESELEEGMEALNNGLEGASLPNWEEVAEAMLSPSAAIECRADSAFGVYGAKAELRLVRRLKEGKTAPVDDEGNAIKPEIKQAFLKVMKAWPDDGELAEPELVELVIPEGADISTATTGVLFPELPEPGWREIQILPVCIGVYPAFNAAAAGTYRVSADQHEVTLSATVYVGGRPVRDGSQVRWEVEADGDGGSFSSQTTTTTNGFTSTKLITSSNPGDTYKARCVPVDVSLPEDDETGQEALSEPADLTGEDGVAATVEVVPGIAASTGMTHGGGALTMPADGKSEREIAVTVKDKFGNTVHEGTPVSWHLKGLGTVKSRGIQTDAAGVARATIMAGTVPGVQTVQVIADAGLHEITIENTPLNPTVAASAASLDHSQSESTMVTASFPGATDGAQVVWHSIRGSIVNAQQVVSGGQASATLVTEPGPDGMAFVSATVGSATGWARIPLVSQGPARVTAVSQPVLAQNDSADGAFSVGTSTGGVASAGYAASTEVSIHLPGKGGQTATIGFGSLGIYDAARFAFDAQETSGVFQDSAEMHDATPAAGAVLDTIEKRSGAGSVKLALASSLALDASPTFDLREGFIWEGWVKAEQLGGDLLYHPGQYRLLMDAGGVLSFSVFTTEGEHTVALPQLPLTAGTWHHVTARYLGEGGGITLQVGTVTAQAAAPGTPAAAAQAAVLGGGFAGWLDEVLIGAEGTGGDVGIYLSTDLPDNTITLDAEGRGTFTVSSSGQMDPVVSGPAKAVGLQIQVAGEPVQNVPQVFTVADKSDIVRMQVLLDAAQPDAPLTTIERQQITAAQLGRMARSGQRCDAANLPVSGTLVQQAEAGFQMGIFIGKGDGSLGEGAYVIRLFGDSQLAIGPAGDHLRERVAQFAEEAARQGSDAAAQSYLAENGGSLVEELAEYCRNKLGDQRPMVDTIEFGPIPADVADKLFTVPDVLDGQEAVEDFSTIAQKDPDLFDDLLDCAKKGLKWTSEAARYTGTLIADGFNYITAPLNDLVKWKTKLIAELEDFIKASVEEGLADGSLGEDSAFSIGTTWGAVRQLTDMIDIISPEVAGQMISSLTATVIGALKGDEQSQKALSEMAPLIGTMAAAEEMNSLLGEGKHFEAGMKFTEFAISASEDAATLSGLGSAVGGVVKFVRKTLKHARPPRGALSPRHLPDFVPDEMGGGFTFTGGNAAGGNGKSWANPPRSREFKAFEKHLRDTYGNSVSISTGRAAAKELKSLENEYGRKVNGMFHAIGDHSARILMGPNATLYDFWHESMHAKQFFEMPETNRLDEWRAMLQLDEHLLEFDVVKRMRELPEAWKALPPMEKAHALIYAKKHFTQIGETVPLELEQWIDEWRQNNKKLDIEEEYHKYLGTYPDE